MRYSIDFDDDEKQALVEQISDVLNSTGAYRKLHKLLVDREQVLLHSDMENLACDLEEFIFNYTQTERL